MVRDSVRHFGSDIVVLTESMESVIQFSGEISFSVFPIEILGWLVQFFRAGSVELVFQFSGKISFSVFTIGILGWFV